MDRLWLMLMLLVGAVGFITLQHDAPRFITYQRKLDTNVIYIEIDARFSPLQKKYIESAVKEWNDVAEGKVLIQSLWNRKAKGLWRQHKKEPSTFMWWVERSSNEIGVERFIFSDDRLAEVVSNDTLGDDIIVYHDLKDQSFRLVILHELGHLFGFDHVDEKGDLMNPRIDAMQECIPTRMAEEWCRQWGCSGRGSCK